MSEVKLHTIAALHKGRKDRTHERFTALHREAVKTGLYSGQSKRYTPIDELDVDRPADVNETVQLRAQDVLDTLRELLTPAWDTEATLDRTNQDANADVVVDGHVLATAVPATYLLYLQKQLDLLRVFISKMPTLPVTDDWTFDETVRYHVTQGVRTTSTRKKVVPLVLHPPTDRHPAQVQAITEDVTVGYWTSVKRSGALPVDRYASLIRRIDVLQDAVKAARERANTTPVQNLTPADALLGFLLDDEGAR